LLFHVRGLVAEGPFTSGKSRQYYSHVGLPL
jgi:hypothetical protein